MTMTFDEGVRRGEHQILHRYMPGQIISHQPKWSKSSERLSGRTLITRVVGIRQVNQIKNSGSSARHRLWSESAEKIKDEITKLVGSSFSDQLVFYEIACGDAEDSEIELDLFPDAWEAKTGDTNQNLLFTSENVPSDHAIEDAMQTYVVFCSPNRRYPPFIDSVYVPSRRSFISTEDELIRRKFTIEGGEPQPIMPACLAGKQGEFNDFAHRFPFDKSNYVSVHVYDVYSPDLGGNSSNILFYSWKRDGLVKPGQEDVARKLADKLMKVAADETDEIEIKDHLSIFVKSERYKGVFASSDEAIIEHTTSFFKGGIRHREMEKMEALKQDSIDAGEVKALGGLFDVYYSDKIQVGQFAIGYVSGRKSDSSGHGKQPLLRRYEGEYRSGAFEAKSGVNKGEWPVFFKLFPTEGVLVVPNARFYETMSDKDPAQSFRSLHAISHSMLKCIPRYSGIEYGLLREYFFLSDPSNIALLLYSNEPGDFRTRGLRYLYDGHLDDLISDARDLLDCPFSLLEGIGDNRHVEGCGACTMVASGCVNYNKELDRTMGLTVLGKLR